VFAKTPDTAQQPELAVALRRLTHEVRNLLSPVSVALHLIRKSEAGGNLVIATETARIEAQVRQLTTLLTDIQDLGRLSHGGVSAELEPVELRQQLAETVQSLSTVLAQRRQTLSPITGEPFLWVMADRGHLRRAIHHVLDNASRFSSANSEIKIELRHQQGLVSMVIRDQGVGFDPSLTEELFQPFRQLNRPQHGAAGIGIGLGLARGLLRSMGGDISASSAGTGLGSEFEISLPSALAPQQLDMQ
jgi:signal transduction histidine kinase